MLNKIHQFSTIIFLFLLLLCVNIKSLNAQELKISNILSIDGDIEIISFFKNQDGDTLAAGNYKGIWKDNSKIWLSEGENDIFLGKWKKGRFDLILSWGGSRNDILFDAKGLANGDMILAGSFTEKIQLGQKTIFTEGNAKAIFLTRINEKGEVLWIALFQGSSWKDWGEMQLDEVKNEIILCGSFHDNIIFDNGQTLLGTGESSVFAGIFDMGTGKVKNLRAFSGNNSVNQAYALSLHVWGNALVIAGNFDRDIVVDSITEMALSRDWDIFLIYLKRDGLGLVKLLKIGGVYEQRVLTTYMDEKNGDIYLSGALAGVMKIGENTILQSQDGLSDIFLLKTSFEGTFKWASLLGGDNVQAPLTLYKSDDHLWLSGYSLGKLKWQGEPLEPLTSFHSFISQWTLTEGKPRLIYSFSGEGIAFPTQFKQFDNQSLLFSGSYRGKVNIRDNYLPFSTRYSGFFGFFPLALTSIKENLDVPLFSLIPNPGDGHIHLNGIAENGEVFVWLGERMVYKVFVFKGDNYIILPTDLPAGIYSIMVRFTNGKSQTRLYFKK